MPYVRQPEDLIPGRPLFYRHRDDAQRRRQRRAGGEPRRPAHQDRRQPGASGHARRVRRLSQASVLQLYDPDRSQALAVQRRDPVLGRFHWQPARMLWRSSRPRTARASASSRRPSRRRRMAAQFAPSRSSIRSAKWHQWEPAGPHSARAAAHAGVRRSRSTRITIFPTRTSIVSLDSDFLASGPASLRYARQFAARRRVARRPHGQ